MADTLTSNLVCFSGLIRNGKTLRVMEVVENTRKAEGCDVYYAGIKEVTLPWKQLSMVPSGYTEKEITEKRYPALVPDWREVPPGSICVIDECWEYFPKRPNGHKPPEYVEQLAVVGHKGIRMVLITQNPHTQIDSFVRGLINEHHFVERKFNTNAARIYSWGKVTDQDSKAERAEAQSKLWTYPKEYFGTYKSAEVHTVKSRWPWKKLATLVAALLVAVGGLWYGIHHVGAVNTRSADAAKAKAVATDKPQAGSPGGMSAEDFWLKGRRVRVAGIPASAPVFDGLQKVKSQPRPEGCLSLVVGKSVRCECTGPHGSKLDIGVQECLSLLKRGWFDETQSYPDAKAANISALNASSAAAKGSADGSPPQS